MTNCMCCGSSNCVTGMFGFTCADCGANLTDQSSQMISVCTCGKHVTEKYNCECDTSTPPVKITDQSNQTIVNCVVCAGQRVQKKIRYNKLKAVKRLVNVGEINSKNRQQKLAEIEAEYGVEIDEETGREWVERNH